MSELSNATLVARLIQAVADDPRKRYYATPEGEYVDRDVEAARQAVLARMTPAAARPTPDAAAMEREFVDVLEEFETTLLTNVGAGRASDAEMAAYEAVLECFRKAVSR